MAKIDRYNGNMAAFAADALSTERTIFGDTTQSDTLDANITADFLRGWGVVGVNENPTKQDFNGLAFTLGQLIAYLHQRGVPEWNADQEYYEGSVVTTLAGIYRLKSGGDGSSDPDTDGGINWELIPTQAKVDAKADQATTYTETEVDGLLNTKADQATTYTETEVDELTGSLAYPNTTLASSSDIPGSLNDPVTAYPHIQGFRTGTGTARTFAQVVEEAAERGARLLTIQELEAGVCQGTGYSYDAEITWTSSPAGVGLVYGNIGAGDGTRVILNTSTDTAAGGYAVSVIGQRQWTDTQYAEIAGGAAANFAAMPQVGGDPIVESGSNADGEWTRWADGTQICTLQSAIVNSAEITWTYPVVFSAAQIYVGVEKTGGGTGQTNQTVMGGRTTSSVLLNLYDSDGVSNDSADITALATGRWK